MCVCSYDKLTFAGLLFVLRVRGCENQCDFALELNRNQQVVAIPACVKAESVREEQEEAEGLLEPQSVGLLSAQLTVKMLSPFFFYLGQKKTASQPARETDRQTRVHTDTHSRTCTLAHALTHLEEMSVVVVLTSIWKMRRSASSACSVPGSIVVHDLRTARSARVGTHLSNRSEARALMHGLPTADANVLMQARTMDTAAGCVLVIVSRASQP